MKDKRRGGCLCFWAAFTFMTLEIFVPRAHAEISVSEFEMLKKTTEGLRQQIRIQGEEIATLKNQLSALDEKPTSGYIVPKDQEAFKKGVFDALKEIRLSEKEETPEDAQLRTIYDDGFYLKGKDDTLKIGGWWQGDVNIFEQDHEGNTRFRNRRVRLDIRGVLEDYFEYRLYTQFAGASANLQEAWLMFKYFPSARLKLGQFKVPFSLESQYSARWIDFVERSIGVTNLQPAEDLGVMLFGDPLEGRLEYAVGVFNGRLRTRDDNNDNFDVATRLVLAPFKTSANHLVKNLYLGGSLTLGHSDETLAGTGFTTAGGTTFMTHGAGVRHANTRTRWGGEFQWLYGPGDIKAEYVGSRFSDVERAGSFDDIHVDSWYVSATHILTGERKVRNKPIDPKHIFSLKDGGWGAWEIGLRFEQLFVNSSPLGLGFVTGTDRVDAMTAALNWWPNKHIRLMLNYVFNDFSDSVPVGSESQSSEHLWLGRAQYNF